MASKKTELLLAAKASIEKRVGESDALLARMGTSREVFERVAMNALLSNPDIAGCSNISIDRSILQCIELGLLPDGRQAAIVPFSGKATLIPMIEGRRQVARNATPGLAISSRVVWSQDHFVHEEGLEPKLEHRPNPDASHDAEQLVAVYAIARWPDAAGPEWEVLYRGDVDRARQQSAAGDKGGSPWNKHYAEMARKTVEGALLKRLPKRPGMPEIDETPGEFAAAEAGGYLPVLDPDEIDDSAWDVVDAEVVDAEVVEPEPEAKPKAAKKKAPAKKRAARKKAAAPKADAKPKADPDPEPDPEPEPAAEQAEPEFGDQPEGSDADPALAPADPTPEPGDNPFDF